MWVKRLKDKIKPGCGCVLLVAGSWGILILLGLLLLLLLR